jgi:dTDP-glucose 4,6-dehydratase
MELNLGTGFEISIKDLAFLIAETMEVEIEIVSDNDRTRPEASEVDRLIASSEKFHNLVGWSAIHEGKDGLTNGLLKTIKWFNDPDNAARYKSQIYNI